MKTAFLMAGVAALALTATAASAQVVNNQSRGQFTVGAGVPFSTNVASVTTNVPISNNALGAAFENGLNRDRAENTNSITSAWQASARSVGNVGTFSGEDGASFSLAGNVTEDCAFYTGTETTLAFDFGQIGVYVSDNTGAANAFRMVDDATMNFDTNLAGCNTPNAITITKSSPQGMLNSQGGGFDNTVFQNNLPYEIRARYSAATGTGTGAGGTKTLTVLDDDADGIGTVSHGAWKSAMDILVTVPVADRALLAGNYTGSFTVTIAAN